MLSETETRILQIMSDRHLITKEELTMDLQRENLNGTDMGLQRLKNMGYVDRIESMGNCLVLTQKGIRAVKQ